ncbi:unnamed protein product [Brassica oleracea]
MESGIDAPLPSSSNVVGHEIFVSEDVNEPVVKPMPLLSPSAMSSSSLLTVSSPALTDSVCGGSLSLVSMPSASSVLLNTTTGISQVHTIGSDIASPPSAVFSGVDPSRTLENSEGQGEGFMVSPVVDTGLDSTQSPQLQSVRTRSVDTDITENTQSESSHQETVFVPTLVLGNVDEAEIEPPNSISLTRGGRESKPPIKYQSMEWKTVRGRGKRGRSGRGSSH